MLRPTIALLSFLAFALAGTARARPALPVPGEPRPPIACDLTGEWIGDAIDDGGTRWRFPIRVRQQGRDLTATIEWEGSNGHIGTEQARGIVDCATRSLEMQTVTVTGQDLVPGLYHVMLGHDFASMSGTWDGPNVLRGRFTARRR